MDKYQFALGITGIVAVMQGVAWLCDYNGTVFAFTSMIIGGVVGTALGITLNFKKSNT